MRVRAVPLLSTPAREGGSRRSGIQGDQSNGSMAWMARTSNRIATST
ncbi:hypothetical protein AKJ09_00943 [Labilithrix luteola]|uniref:Uncharacterized protein n=1 Tax=Labilithrix luteola TaxID=1391654 RepID=A0A0K1PMF1_9BACT|nr:hypothetical protein AKJ09_00943 [Labilithrix luteola]